MKFNNRNQNLRRACLWKEIDWTGSSPANRRPSSSSSEEPPVSPRTAGGDGPGPSAERRRTTARSTADLSIGTPPGSETPAREKQVQIGIERRKFQCPTCQQIACESAFERNRHININATCGGTVHTSLAREMQAGTS
ncbi:hypothetical protein LZ554_002805 [Drepanopeziza brunnea f. sp. 'monogermtubi']|nr:hypothetical protein LZ554_002805 [Drepanopeziza brunnea f. sp. 'monogermtubi']